MNKKTLFYRSALVILIIISAEWGFCVLFGRQVIDAMYNGQSVRLFNGIIQGQAIHSVEYYYQLAWGKLLTVSFDLLVIYGVFLGCYGYRREINFWNATLSLFLFLFAGEAYLRYTYSAWPFEEKMVFPIYMTAKDRSLRWRPEPYKEGRNSLGLRNREITKKENQKRILFLGDSLVWMGETSSGKLYTETVEGKLNEQGKRPQVEVVNAGVNGYTTYQELEFLKLYGLEMRPDMVVLCFVFNDVYDKYLHKPGTKTGWDPEILLNRFNKEGPIGRLFSRSYLAHQITFSFECVKWWVDQTFMGVPRYDFRQRLDFYLAWQEYGWGSVDKRIGEMNDVLRQRKVRLAIIVFPMAEQMDSEKLDYDKDYLHLPQKKIGVIAEKYSIPLMDLTEVLRRNGGANLFKDYLHLNSKGNDVVARELPKHMSDLLKDQQRLLAER